MMRRYRGNANHANMGGEEEEGTQSTFNQHIRRHFVFLSENINFAWQISCNMEASCKLKNRERMFIFLELFHFPIVIRLGSL